MTSVEAANFTAIEGLPAVTVEAWVEVDSYQLYGVVWDVSGLMATVQGFNGGTLSVGVREPWEANHGTIVSAEPLSLDTWHHVAMTFDAGELSLWVDGALVETVSTTVSTVPDIDYETLYVGKEIPGDYVAGVDGRIDQFRISSAVRYSDGFTPATHYAVDEHTVVQWDFAEGEGETTADSSGNGHTGVINGAAWSEHSSCDSE